MTVNDICSELGVARSTFHHWRTTGRGPQTLRLPNGALRVLRDEFMSWIQAMMEDRA